MNKEKISKILKSKVMVGVVCFFLGGIVLGGNSEEIKPTENVSKQQTTQPKPTEKPADKQKNEFTQMNLGEAYTIKSSDGGEYSIAIEGIRFTDERNQFSEKNSEHVIFLDYNYKNLSSTEEVNIFDSNFKIMDDQGNVLTSYPVSDDNRRSQSLPIGGKCSASGTYAMPVTSKTLKVLFYDNMFGKPLGEVTIDTGL